MPNRIVREGIITSELVNALSWHEEVFYRRLLSVVDDYGRFSANPSLLRAALFPLRLNDTSDQDIGKWLRGTEKAGLVRVYQIEGKGFLEVVKFNQQVRAKVSKYPAPPSTCSADAKQPLGIGAAPAHLDGVGGGDVRNTLPPFSGGFLKFWTAWPKNERKEAKGKCWEIWKKKDFDLISETILAHVDSLKSSQRWREGYIPAPKVYLTERRWEGAEEAEPMGEVI